MKHAFLIIAHKNYEQLDILISLLDNENNDIFIHIDKKSPVYTLPICRYSNIYQIDSKKINWGAYSLVDCELRLLEKAIIVDHYHYFHLLSGQDLPIKPIEEIVTFFELHDGYNFIHFDSLEASLERINRVKYYHVFQEFKNRYKRSIWSALDRIFVDMQKYIGFDRSKRFSVSFKAGSQWWSITRDLAKYVLSNRDFIKRHFKYTMCDEMFLQTLVYNSPYYETLYVKEIPKSDDQNANQRLIDFKRGHPYIWTIDDIEEIKNSNLMFARKFDETVDSDVINAVVELNLISERSVKY